MNRRNLGDVVFDNFNNILLFILVVATLYPFLYVAFASISEPYQIVKHQGLLLYPLGLNFGSYKLVFQNPMILTGYRNTLVYVVSGTVLNLLMTSFGAYVLSRKNVLWRNVIMFAVVFTMFFNGGLIPFYLTVKNLALTDKLWAMILPTAMSTYNLIVMRTSFAAIPDSMEESAKIDGANDFTILFRIILPLSMPVVAVMILFYGVAHWNAWFNAMIFLRSRENYPLQLILREILIASSTDDMTTGVGSMDKEPVAETIKYATIIVATLPILTVYPFLQKYFVKGIMIGALKG
jgi:putative aldouronate transport system permease protein